MYYYLEITQKASVHLLELVYTYIHQSYPLLTCVLFLHSIIVKH